MNRRKVTHALRHDPLVKMIIHDLKNMSGLTLKRIAVSYQKHNKEQSNAIGCLILNDKTVYV